MAILIKGGRVIDPARNLDGRQDILIEGEKITTLAANLEAPAGARVIDAGGMIVTPGLIDMHVHLREPGYEQKETIASGTRAAAAGGFTAVACMANTNPVADSASVIYFIKEKARQEGVVRVYPVGALSKGLEGKEIAEIGDLAAAGAVAISDDGRPVMNALVMRHALEYAKMFNLPVISHCEDEALANDGLMHEGLVATILGLRGIPAAAEEVMVARDLILAELTGGRLHLAHVSTAGSVRLLKEARARGVRVTAEATPHHLCLTDMLVQSYDTSTKVNPPLRPAGDVAAVAAALAAGDIDVIASDHAPHADEDKDVEYDYAPFGMVGLETAVPLVVTELILPGKLTWQQAIKSWTANPARILNIPGGSLVPGGVADVTIIDPDMEKEVDVNEFYSRGHNSPLQGRKLKGWPVLTIVGGRVVMENGKIIEE
ncbi:dihydroorotase [Neomoorella thermoacetica]|uniref:Dihydroorotase n=2 Tax=Neomoorella thermoacetica TaxID=1525 RepID=A0A1J5JSN2_NEOTH|nr:dihydroorotase [Moorella thermoacetica]AKX93630.1 dihydroorotase [Moorella thermoacetica]AKX96277.1 dihydroorotase [Moorella thermoacetica]OIQ09715.1 dihydroorotase [Moorella thermoacetica]OIQ55490.1 dihydroorotase [Moorella thermoacetica]OIQ55741.1 dihydroorotase [Moorella thermoacetica]